MKLRPHQTPTLSNTDLIQIRLFQTPTLSNSNLINFRTKKTKLYASLVAKNDPIPTELKVHVQSNLHGNQNRQIFLRTPNSKH